MKRSSIAAVCALVVYGSTASALTLNSGPAATATTAGVNRVLWCVAENLTTKPQDVTAELFNGKGEPSGQPQTKTLQPNAKDWVAGWNASSGGGLTHCRFTMKTNKVRGYLEVQDNFVTTVVLEAK